MDNQKNQNVKFEKIKNHLKKNALNADKMQIKIILLFLLVGLHIFLIPNDILDKFPFLASYTEFVANYVPFVKTISLQIKSIPQIATFYASNMAILSLFIFFPLFVYNALLVNIKRFEMFGWYEYNPYNGHVSHHRVLYIIAFLFPIFITLTLNFEPENIFLDTNKFDLIKDVVLFTLSSVFIISFFIVYLINQIITLFLRLRMGKK